MIKGMMDQSMYVLVLRMERNALARLALTRIDRCRRVRNEQQSNKQQQALLRRAPSCIIHTARE